MGYSFRTRIASKTEPIAKAKQVTKPSVKKAQINKSSVKAVVTKKTAIRKINETKSQPEMETKKSIASKQAVPKKAVNVKKATPKKTNAAAVPKKDVKTKPVPSKPINTKLASPSLNRVAIKEKIKGKFSKKISVKKIETPSVLIEEVSVPSFLPVLEIVADKKIIQNPTSKHIRFTDDEFDNISGSEKKIIKYDYFEDQSDPAPFELYSSESESEENVVITEVEVDDFDEKNDEISKTSTSINNHSEIEPFTSQEEPRIFNWAKPGSNYYHSSEKLEKSEDSNLNVKHSITDAPDVTIKNTPTVVSNPFGFGFTAIINAANNAATNSGRPSNFDFNSHFQSVSSPLDKLCNLTTQSNSIKIGNSYNFCESSVIATSSFLPTSPAPGLSKISRSPSNHNQDREERSPSAIQSIIVDDKHEDFSAF